MCLFSDSLDSPSVVRGPSASQRLRHGRGVTFRACVSHPGRGVGSVAGPCETALRLRRREDGLLLAGQETQRLGSLSALSVCPPSRSLCFLDPRSACSFPGPLSPHPGQRLDVPSQCGARRKRVLWDRGLARTGSGLRGRSGSVLGRRGSRRGDHAPLPGQRLASQWVQASGAAEHPPVHRQPHDEDCPSGHKRPPCTLGDASAGGGGCLAC